MVSVVDVVGLSLKGAKWRARSGGGGGTAAADSPVASRGASLASSKDDRFGAALETMSACTRLLGTLAAVVARVDVWCWAHVAPLIGGTPLVLVPPMPGALDKGAAGRSWSSEEVGEDAVSQIDAVGARPRSSSLFATTTTTAATAAATTVTATTTVTASTEVDLDGAHPYELQMLRLAGESVALQTASAPNDAWKGAPRSPVVTMSSQYHSSVESVPNEGSAKDNARHDRIVSLLTASIAQPNRVTQGRDTIPASRAAFQPSTQGRHSDSTAAKLSIETRQRARLAVQWFEQKGYAREQAVGTVANLQAQSDMNPTAVGDDGKAYGLAQWNADRQADFKKTFGFDIRGSTLNQQLAFVDWELRFTQSNAGRNLSAATTPQDAAEVVARLYARSLGVDRQTDAGESRRRASASHALYRDMYASGIGQGNAVDVANVVANAPSATSLMTSTASSFQAQATPAAMINSQAPNDIYMQPTAAYGMTNVLSAALHDQTLAFQLNSGLR